MIILLCEKQSSLNADLDNFILLKQLAIHEFWHLNVSSALQLIKRALDVHDLHVPALFTLGEILLFYG